MHEEKGGVSSDVGVGKEGERGGIRMWVRRGAGLKRALLSGEQFSSSRGGGTSTGVERREDIQLLSGHRQHDFQAPPTVFSLSCFWTEARHC